MKSATEAMSPPNPLLAHILPGDWSLAVQAIVYGGLVALVAWGVWYACRHFRSDRRAQRHSEERFRRLFEEATVALIEEDFTAVARRLDELRAQGVTDLRAHLAARPGLTVELFQCVRPTAVNRRALALMGAADLADYRTRMAEHTRHAAPRGFEAQLLALWEGRDALTVDASFRTHADQVHRGILQWTVPHQDGRRNLSQVLLVFTDLTAQRETEERYRHLFEGAVEGVYETLPTGRLRSANPALARILGFASPAELLAQPPEALARIYVLPERRQHFFAALAARDHLPNYESEIRRPDGTAWIEENVRVVRDPEGRPLYYQGFVTDITERKLAEQELRSSELRYRMLFEHTPIAILESDDTAVTQWMAGLRARGVTDLAAHLRDHPEEKAAHVLNVRIAGANAAALRMVGASNLAEVITRLPSIVTPEVLAFREEAALGIWAGRYHLDREIVLKAIDGSLRRVHAYRWIPVVDGQPQFHRAQLALVDLTAAHTAQQALDAERERMSVTLRAMAEGVVTCDDGGVVRYINESACAIAGCTAATAVGRRLDEVCVLRHARTDAGVARPDAAARADGRVVDLPPDTVIVRADGTRRQLEGCCAPLRDLPGRDLGAVLVMRDVTDHVRLESDLRRASNLESIGILAGGIAHDFNNILAIIMGNLTLALLDEQVKQSGGKRWLLEAERGAARARDLTQQLLTFAKGGEPVRTNVQLPELVREAAEFALHGSSVRCEFVIPEGLPTADVDKAQIGQVVQNLVINAVQAMPQGGVIRISLGNVALGEDEHPPLAAGRYLKLSIADSGRGIHPDHLPRIFEPYFTTKSAGMGLGLATVYSIVKKHRGHITVESELDAGTTFHLWLPAAPAAEAPRRVSQAPFAGGMRGRVLFMDDEEPIRLMAAVLLGRLGLDPTIAEDGAAAVRHFRTAHTEGNPFDAVVMDLTVPGGVGGLEALREMQTIDPDVRAIVSSGYSSDPVLANFRAHGFRGMVAKPYRITDLAAALREVMGEDKVG